MGLGRLHRSPLQGTRLAHLRRNADPALGWGAPSGAGTVARPDAGPLSGDARVGAAVPVRTRAAA